MLLNLRHRLEYGALLAFVLFIRSLPLDWATAGSARLLTFVGPKTRQHRRALKNLEKAMPEKSATEREAIALAMWDNLGRVMAESFRLNEILADASRIECENAALVARYRGKMGASVFAGLHMGNWEIGMWPTHLAGARPAGVYRLVENPYVDRFIRRLRAGIYPAGLFASKGDEGLGTVMRVASYLRAGGTLGLLADVAEWRGVQVPFFGHMTWMTVAPAWLARRAGTSLWVGRVVRIGKQSRFKVAFHELKVPRTDQPGEDIRELTAAMHRQFEIWIREHPEQWMWSNKRWHDHEMPGGTQD